MARSSDESRYGRLWLASDHGSGIICSSDTGIWTSIFFSTRISLMANACLGGLGRLEFCRVTLWTGNVISLSRSQIGGHTTYDTRCQWSRESRDTPCGVSGGDLEHRRGLLARIVVPDNAVADHQSRKGTRNSAANDGRRLLHSHDHSND